MTLIIIMYKFLPSSLKKINERDSPIIWHRSSISTVHPIQFNNKLVKIGKK